MMKPIAVPVRAGLLLALLASVGVGAHAANNDSATATAVVLIPIAVSKTTDMNFGNVVEGNGTVTLNTDGSRSISGGTPLVAFGSSPTAALFHVTGDTSQTFAITYPGTSTQLINGANNMAFTYCAEVKATATPSATSCPAAPSTGALTSGNAYVYVGGTVVVGAGQVPGTYAGTVVVSVDYN